MAKQIILSEELRFSTQKAALDHFRQILHAYEDGDSVSDPEHEEHLLLLIANHPEAVQKIGVGIDHFFIDYAYQGSRCFHIARIDGSSTDFSYPTAVMGERPSLDREFKEACRVAVQPYLFQARDKFFQDNQDSEGRVKCELTEQLITTDEADIDHKGALPFNVMVETWITATKLELSPDLLTPPTDNQYVSEFADEALKREWVTYHNTFCDKHKSLRVIHKTANRSLSPRGRIYPSKNPLQLTLPT